MNRDFIRVPQNYGRALRHTIFGTIITLTLFFQVAEHFERDHLPTPCGCETVVQKPIGKYPSADKKEEDYTESIDRKPKIGDSVFFNEKVLEAKITTLERKIEVLEKQIGGKLNNK